MNDRTLDVTACVRRWNQGEERAAEELIQHLQPVISCVVRAHLPRRDHEDDLIQEIFMKVFSRLHQYQGRAPLRHWVSRLALTTCFDRLRAQKSHPETCCTDLTPEEADVFDTAWLGVTTPDATAGIHARELVGKLFSMLTPGDRSLVSQVYFEGISLEEISKQLGWGIARTKTRLFRARVNLRKMLQILEPCR